MWEAIPTLKTNTLVLEIWKTNYLINKIGENNDFPNNWAFHFIKWKSFSKQGDCMLSRAYTGKIILIPTFSTSSWSWWKFWFTNFPPKSKIMFRRRLYSKVDSLNSPIQVLSLWQTFFRLLLLLFFLLLHVLVTSSFLLFFFSNQLYTDVPVLSISPLFIPLLLPSSPYVTWCPRLCSKISPSLISSP